MGKAGPLSSTQKISLLGVYVFFGLLSLLPLPWVRIIGDGVGSLYYRLGKKRVNIARVNLKLCYPELEEEQREKIVKQCMQSAAKWFLESGAIWIWSTKKILARIRVHNIELFQQALAKGQGVALVIPHLGNWEIMGPFITQHSKFACFYQPETKSPVITEFVRRQRSHRGVLMAPANATGVRQLYKHLRDGKVAGILPDHFPSDKMSVYAPFFNRPAITGTLVSALANKNQSPVIASAAIRTAKGFDIYFIEVKDQHSENSVLAATSLNKAVEQCIAFAPEQYQWVYPRFRKRVDPQSQTDPYRAHPV